MGFLVTLLAPKVGQTFARLIAYVGIPLLAIALLVIALHAYGHSRFKAGQAHADQQWHDASNAVVAQSNASANTATAAADQRQTTHDQQVSDERNRIDAAEQNGASPLDALFGN